MRRSLAALHAALLCSGSAALLYESAWTRMLHRLFGVSDLAVATVLGCFFLGLGLGSALAARFARRVTRPARAYAILELGVAAYAVASLAVMPALHAAYAGIGGAMSFEALSLVRFALAAAALLLPTIAMGATLPVLVALLRQDGSWSGGVTALYTTNTLGATLGAAAAGFWLLPQYGTSAAVSAAAVLGVIAAVIALRLMPHERTENASAASSSAAKAPALRLELVLTALSGGIALASEVLWTRVLRIVVHGTTTAFAAMLVNYLLGVAIGALLARRIVRVARAGLAFGVLQSLVVIASGVAMALVPHLPRVIPLVRRELDIVPHETWVLVLASAVILFPLAVITGTGLPLTWAMAAERSEDSAAASGRLLAANTAGGLVGALAAGFLLVPSVGIEASIFVVASVAALASAIALRSTLTRSLPLRIVAATGPFALLVALLVLRPSLSLPFLLGASQQPFEAIIRGPDEAWRDGLVFLREGRNTTVTIRRSPTGLALYNDGRPESGFSAGEPGFGTELVLLGALPGLFSDQRSSALIVGVGAGHTTTMALAGGFERVIAVELEEAVVEAARVLHDARGRPFPLDDPRAELVVDDARNRIALAPDDSLDAVVSQPSHPWLAGSSALYTDEFVRDVARVLRPGGTFALWVNLFRMDVENLRSVLGTLADVFAHVHGLIVEGTSLVLVASDSDLDWARAAERMREPALARPLRAVRLGALPLLASKLELDTAAIRTLGEGAERIRDDRPLLEFRLARLSNRSSVRLPALDRATEGSLWIHPGSTLATHPDIARIASERIGLVSARPRALAAIERALEGIELAPAEREMLAGRLADARGNIGEAIAHYERASQPDAESLLDRLRAAEGMNDALIRRALTRSAQPTEASPLLGAALARGDTSVLASALAIADRIGYPGDRDLRDLVRRYLEGGCEALLAPASERVLATNAEAARVAARCAAERGDDERGGELLELAVRAQWREAGRWAQLGESALAGGNGGLAWVALRRALDRQPSNSAAAGALARLHARDGRPQLAREVLLDAWSHNEGFPEARQQLATVASELEIDLGTSEPADESATSTSTAPMDAP